MNLKKLPTDLVSAIRFFGSPADCHAFLSEMRWPAGVRCAHCESAKVGKLVVTQAKSRSSKVGAAPIERRLWNCGGCRKQFTVKTGTIFEDSALGLDKWLPALWLLTNAKNGISSCELARALGITQKSAWFMGHRLRAAMREGGFVRMKGEVESDETFIGGKAINMHSAKRRRKITGTGGHGKAVVHGLLERGAGEAVSRVCAAVVPDARMQTIQPILRTSIEPGSSLYTDTAAAYLRFNAGGLTHERIDHALEYVRGRVSTNGLENFWSLLKRTLKGTYVSVSPGHLARYLEEQVTRFNERGDDDLGRFLRSIQRVSGRRLAYAALVGAGNER